MRNTTLRFPITNVAWYERCRALWSMRAAILVVCVLCGASVGCGGYTRSRLVDAAACAELDSLLRDSAFPTGEVLTGKVTIDAEQRRLRGQVRIDVKSSGDLVLEFSSSILLGSHHEDFVFSVVADTMRVLDRERGEFYEGREAERFLDESLGMHVDIHGVMELIAGTRSICRGAVGLVRHVGARGEVVFTGERNGGPIRLVFAAAPRRLREITWPVRFGSGDTDRLRASYDWTVAENGVPALRELTLWLEEREWRCRISSISG